MKKFFVTFFILAVLAGAGFFVGWVQLTVPTGSYGIIQSKTHGIDPLPVKSGEFRWLWYKLIPTNVSITNFQLKPEKFSVSFNSSLPSGDVYASFTGLGSTDFSYALNGDISFHLNPDNLVTLISQQKATDQQSLDAYIQEIAQNIKVIIMRTFSSAETDTQRIEKILSGSPDADMEREISVRFPEIRDFSFVLTYAKYPDFILYQQIKLLYEDFLGKQREYVAAGSMARAENHIESQFRFKELEQYGELLTKYPVLLEYLSMNLNNEE